jgi:alkanesulfonate monooxygenase SsuD/methylene tetrahydromethanopterin reductase-like flavin-dependent oxidoreductase (luciferase family)
VTIRLGFQIPNFSYGTGVEQLFPTVIAQACEAESAGFDSVFVMDHFYQLPMLGSPDQPMLEAYTTLGALATATERVQLGALVTGNTYRNPTLLTSHHHTGRHQRRPRNPQCRHRLVRARTSPARLRIRHIHRPIQPTRRSAANPRPHGQGRAVDVLRRLVHHGIGGGRTALPRTHPILIGGSGEKKTFSLAARYADHLNIIAGFDELPGKLKALAKRCEEAGRDRSTLETSVLLTVLVDDNAKPDQVPAELRGRMVAGSAEQVAEQVKAHVVDVGIDGVIINLPIYTPGVVTAVAEALRPVVGV